MDIDFINLTPEEIETLNKIDWSDCLNFYKVFEWGSMNEYMDNKFVRIALKCGLIEQVGMTPAVPTTINMPSS